MQVGRVRANVMSNIVSLDAEDVEGAAKVDTTGVAKVIVLDVDVLGQRGRLLETLDTHSIEGFTKFGSSE